jgi:hypothetical protein
VFRLDLAAPAQVVATAEAMFDTVLYRFADDGRGAGSCVSLEEDVCSDDASSGDTNSFLDEMLEAGVHYYVVDGFNETSEGPYVFSITVE